MVATGGEGEGLEGESSQRGDGDGEATAATRMGAATATARDGGGVGLVRRRRRSIGKKQRGKNEIFRSAVYIEGTFSTGWSHQPVLKACFGQAKRREATPFSTGWWNKPVLKAPPLVPVYATTRY